VAVRPCYFSGVMRLLRRNPKSRELSTVGPALPRHQAGQGIEIRLARAAKTDAMGARPSHLVLQIRSGAC
jgi:hypothetical protein